MIPIIFLIPVPIDFNNPETIAFIKKIASITLLTLIILHIILFFTQIGMYIWSREIEGCVDLDGRPFSEFILFLFLSLIPFFGILFSIRNIEYLSY